MHDRPDARELVEAVREFLADEVLPTVEDPRLRFRTLVALNALGIASRELAAERATGPSADELDALARRIRTGEADDVSPRELKELVAAKLRVSNPTYLERYGDLGPPK